MFDGFPKGTLKFLAGLSKNNSKEWFEEHREDYEAFYLEPAKELVAALAPKLQKIDPDVQAVPKVNGSILRINRDVRFSKDKAPYKDHLDLFFWSGDEKGWDASGFFFRLTPKSLLLGAGIHGFMPPVLARYRKALEDDAKGARLQKIAATLAKAGYELGGASYKKTPRGVPEDHPRAVLFKHGGLWTGWEGKHPKELESAKLVDFVIGHFKAAAPLHAWLKAI